MIHIPITDLVIEEGALILITGRRGTGKSWLANWIKERETDVFVEDTWGGRREYNDALLATLTKSTIVIMVAQAFESFPTWIKPLPYTHINCLSYDIKTGVRREIVSHARS